MSASEVVQYVVTFRYQEKGLADILELTSALVNGGFATSLNDKEGHPHELGTNSFGLISALDKEQVREQAEGLAEIALGQKPEVEIETWETFQQAAKS